MHHTLVQSLVLSDVGFERNSIYCTNDDNDNNSLVDSGRFIGGDRRKDAARVANNTTQNKTKQNNTAQDNTTTTRNENPQTRISAHWRANKVGPRAI